MPLRIDPDWWEETLQPLRRLEAAATSGRPLAQLPVTSPGFKEGLRNPPESPSSSNASPSVKTLESGVTTLDTAAGGGRAAGVGTLDGVKAGSSSKKTSPKVAVHDERLNGVFTPAEDDRAAREDVEMETRTLTEPLPTNQQAYKSHHLYALERWLTKYQVLHPKGPILGYCAGQPVYPRTSVQVREVGRSALSII